MEFKLAKCSYKDKIKNLLSTGDSQAAWAGLKSMMGMQSKKCPISISAKSDLYLFNEQNTSSTADIR